MFYLLFLIIHCNHLKALSFIKCDIRYSNLANFYQIIAVKYFNYYCFRFLILFNRYLFLLFAIIVAIAIIVIITGFAEFII